VTERLVEEMALYHAYHRDLRNRLAHFAAGAPILVSVLIVGCWTPLDLFGVSLSVGPIAAVALFGFHLRLDPVLALLASPFTFGCLAAAGWTTGALTRTEAWILVGALFGGGWLLLSLGHYIEGHAPSLAKSWRQPLIAPLFYVAELGAPLGLRRELWRRVAERGAGATRADPAAPSAVAGLREPQDASADCGDRPRAAGESGSPSRASRGLAWGLHSSGAGPRGSRPGRRGGRA